MSPLRVSSSDARRLGALARAKPLSPAAKVLAKAKRERHEDSLEAQIQAARFPYFHRRQYEFLAGRKFKADFAFPEAMILVEVDGGMWVQGRHNRGAGREADLERDALAQIAGWRILRCSPRHVDNGRALAWISAILERNP